LAREIDAARARIAGARSEIDAVIKALSERRASASPETAAAIDVFQTRLLTLSGVVPATVPANVWWVPPKSIDTLRYLGGALDALITAVDGADSDPSVDA